MVEPRPVVATVGFVDDYWVKGALADLQERMTSVERKLAGLVTWLASARSAS